MKIISRQLFNHQYIPTADSVGMTVVKNDDLSVDVVEVFDTNILLTVIFSQKITLHLPGLGLNMK